MADLVLDVDYNITRAEAKQQKLNREFELSQRKTENIKNKIEELNKTLEEEKNKQNEIREQIVEQTKEAALLERQIEKIKNGNGAMQEIIDLGSLDEASIKLKKMVSDIQKNEATYDKSKKSSEKLTSEIDKQNIALKKQEATTANIADKLAVGSQNQKKFGDGIKKSNTPLAKFGKRIKELVKSALIFTVITKALNAMKDALGSYLKQDSELSKSVSKLKGNLSTIGSTLTSALAPYIKWFIDKLVTITSIIGNVMARALGKNVKQMAALAKNTEKTEKSANKATASFDTLNTLSSNSEDKENSNIDTSAIETGAFDKSIDKILKKISTLKETASKAFSGIGKSAKKAFETNKPEFERAWKELIKPISNWAFKDFNEVIAILGEGVSDIISIFSTEDFSIVLNGIINLFVFVWSFIKGGLDEAKTVLRATFNLFSGIISGFIQGTAGLFTFIQGVFQVFVGAIEWVVALFKGDTEAMQKATAKMKDGIKNILNGIIKMFAGLVNSLSSIVNFVWEHIVGALRGIVNSVGGLVSKIGNVFGYENWGWKWEFKTPTIPKWNPPALSTGAILPGGSPMLAWVNDQPKGQPYVEGSIENIAAAFEKYLGGRTLGNQNITLEAKGNWAQFIKWMNLQIKQEDNRASIWG